jgi:RNA polymerase sigma-70 factor, ECF subfamily
VYHQPLELDDIIRGCKEGNRTCQDALVRNFAPGLLALCLRYTSDKELAKDALQECFINAFKYIKSYDGRGSFEGWIKRIAVTSTITLHKKYHKIYFEESDIIDFDKHGDVPDIYGQMSIDEIMVLLKKLPESLFMVFNLVVIEGFDHKEVASTLGIAESTSRSALCKARIKIIELINKQDSFFLGYNIAL